jgi:hypothetical protein
MRHWDQDINCTDLVQRVFKKITKHLPVLFVFTTPNVWGPFKHFNRCLVGLNKSSFWYINVFIFINSYNGLLMYLIIHNFLLFLFCLFLDLLQNIIMKSLCWNRNKHSSQMSCSKYLHCYKQYEMVGLVNEQMFLYINLRCRISWCKLWT